MPLAWPHCSLLAGSGQVWFHCLHELISKRAHLGSLLWSLDPVSRKNSGSHHIGSNLQGKSDLLETKEHVSPNSDVDDGGDPNPVSFLYP